MAAIDLRMSDFLESSAGKWCRRNVESIISEVVSRHVFLCLKDETALPRTGNLSPNS